MKNKRKEYMETYVWIMGGLLSLAIVIVALLFELT